MKDRIAEMAARAPRQEAREVAARLEANLAILERMSPRAAQVIRTAEPRADVVFIETDEDVLACEIEGRGLCSRRRPIEEARRLVEGVDLERAGTAVVLGFGVGHHVAALAEVAREVSAIVVFEPDVGLLRAVFERVDHRSWMERTRFLVVTECDNAATLSESLRGLEGALAVGVEFVEHPPSRARLGGAASRFAETFTRVFRAIRTHIITTMVQTDVTVRNELMNLDHYVRWPGIHDLRDAAAGRPAIVVSAGPSLRRNIDLLKTPGLRDRCVIICVQTVLRQLIAEGIHPHFVTAIDYHEISKRFYEGLCAEDVADVTLIAEARANPAILDAFPGPIRMPQDEFLTRLLGWEDRDDRGTMIPAATVAHLAYYVARHLGADPVILVGQDLAFTDGQYYAKGAAIHDVWAPELNAFNTLEMMEWQRIVRTRGTLHEATDHLGRRVYTDEQMATYLAQFERDFHGDVEQGLTIVDATEGGVSKAHTSIMTLAEAINRYASVGREDGGIGALGTIGARHDETVRQEVRERLECVRMDVRRISSRSREARDLLHRMGKSQRDVERTNRMIDQVNEIRDEVHSLAPAFDLVMRLNQMGALKRFKADRAIKLAPKLDRFERQRRQIERDAMNLEWVAEFADLLDGYMKAAHEAFDGGAKITRDILAPSDEARANTTSSVDVRSTGRVAGVISVLGPELETAGRSLLGRPVIGWTLSRLARCERIDTVVLVTDDVEQARRLLRDAAPRIDVEIIEGACGDAGRAHSIAAGRAWAECCWRGGLAGLTVFDEVLDPIATSGALERVRADAAVLVGGAWGLVDPQITDELVLRHRESPEGNALTFTQAPPGLAPAVMGRELVEDLAQGQRDGLIFASTAGALGYIPTRPRQDPIAQPTCVQIDAMLRGTLQRFVLDDPGTIDEMERALRDCSSELATMSGDEIARRWRAFAVDTPAHFAREITLELTTRRSTSMDRFRHASGIARGPIVRDDAARLLEEISRWDPDTRLTLAGIGDPLEHPGCIELVHAARSCGIPFVHVRTDLLCGHETIEALASSPADVISVDVLAHQASTYQRIAGVDRFRDVCEGVDELLRRREAHAGMPRPWIVPRITRCDTVYEEIEVFFDKWILVAGAAVIDQLGEARSGERIEPLGKPASVIRRDARRRMMILSDGSVVSDEMDPAASVVANVFTDGIEGAWAAVQGQRMPRLMAGEHDHPDLRTGW